ncbi:MAG: glycosyltransferase family 9 protein [Candidatus Marinimicrobia bacterium]|nr:glycosyltransferase family 9 protein [Candidatus Neomarinimicrobiota bacterium]
MIFKKYYSLIIKILSYIKIDLFNLKYIVIKLFKFIFSIILLPIEILGDMIFSYKRFFSFNISDPKKILIIKIDQMGDVLFSTMLLPLIKEKYPQSDIDYVINKKAEQILINNPHINNIYYWQSFILNNVPGRGKFSFISWKNNLSTWRILKKQKYDIIINARSFIPSSNLSWKFLNPKKLIAFDIGQQSFLADNIVSYNLYTEEWQNYLNLLKPLGINKVEGEPRSEFYNLSDCNIESENLAIISPISFNSERSWSLEKWIKAVKILIKKNYLVILIGTREQKECLEKIKDDTNSLIFIDSIPKLADLIKKADLFLGVESFPAHLALTFKIKLFSVVNTKLFYVSGKSKHKIIDGRSMLSQFSNVKIIDLNENPEDVL